MKWLAWEYIGIYITRVIGIFMRHAFDSLCSAFRPSDNGYLRFAVLEWEGREEVINARMLVYIVAADQCREQHAAPGDRRLRRDGRHERSRVRLRGGREDAVPLQPHVRGERPHAGLQQPVQLVELRPMPSK